MGMAIGSGYGETTGSIERSDCLSLHSSLANQKTLVKVGNWKVKKWPIVATPPIPQLTTPLSGEIEE